MTTTRKSISPARYDLALETTRYFRAKRILEHARVGSIADREAHRTIERIVARAERHGILDEFLTAALAD